MKDLQNELRFDTVVGVVEVEGWDIIAPGQDYSADEAVCVRLIEIAYSSLIQ